MRSRLFVLFCLPALSAVCPSQDLKGVDVLLKRLADVKAAPKGESATQVLEAKLANGGAQGQPKQQADYWLEIHDQWRKVQTDQVVSMGPGSGVGYSRVIAALPPPESWPEIRAMAEARKSNPIDDALLRLTAHTLTADAKAQREDVSALRKEIAALGDEGDEYYEHYLTQLSFQLAQQAGDIGTMVSLIERQLTASNESGVYGENQGLPDLVTHLGEDRAEAVLTRLLLGAKSDLVVPVGLRTQALAHKVALANISKLQVPQWSLVTTSPDPVALYEAMDKRFPEAQEAPTRSYYGGRPAAKGSYVLGLILRGDNEKATQVLGTFKEEQYAYVISQSLTKLAQTGHSKMIARFLISYMAKNPSAEHWETLIYAASSTGLHQEMISMIENALKNPDIKKESRLDLQGYLSRALLATDKVEEGIALTRKVAQERRGFADGTGLVDLGIALKRQDLVDEGLAIAQKPTLKSSERSYSFYYAQQLGEVYFKLGRYAEAEEEFFKAIELSQNLRQQYEYSMPGSSSMPSLMRLYNKVGRHQDAVDLLEKVPGWGVADASEILAGEVTYYGYTEEPLGYFIASSLHAVGRDQDAKRVIVATLRQMLNYDPAYELLIKLEGQNAMPNLESLATRDRFEERPLIWKAVLLLNAGKVDEAEQTIKTAIAIDPSDGETKFGHRMKVYSVYADVLAAKGENSQAEIYRGAMKAIRLAEEADTLNAAGLTSRAIAMYKDSLQLFEAAYCIQSRLAVDLASVGRFEEAEKHYRRAYELMPDSFGQLESHCFGCEQVFSGEMAQNIAEEVFGKLLLEQPNKPQVHYLMGQLRLSQGRTNDAVALFTKAAELDPDYMSAWKAISDISQTMTLPAKDMQQVALAMYRLDPLMMRAVPNFAYVTDLEALYKLAERTITMQESASEGVLELTASKQKLEAEKKNQEPSFEEDYMDEMEMMSPMMRPKISKPGAVLARTPILSVIAQLRSMNIGVQEEE